MKTIKFNWLRLSAGMAFLFAFVSTGMAQDLLFRTNDGRVESLNPRQTEVFDKIWDPDSYVDYHFIDISNMDDALGNRRIRINVGNVCGEVWMDVRTIEFIDNDNYYLFAEHQGLGVKDACGTASIQLRMSSGSPYGVLKMGEDVFMIDDLSGGQSILLREINLELPDGHEQMCEPLVVGQGRPQGDLPTGSGSRNCDVRVLFLFTNAADGRVANRTAHAQSHIDQANQALANSGVGSGQLRFVLANALTLSTVDETNQSASTVLGDVRTDGTAQNLRNSNDADLVCLVADHTIASFGTTAGIAYSGFNGAPASNNFGYSVIRFQGNLGDFVFTHEVGHNMGGGHEPANNTSTNIDRAHAFTWTTGWWIFRRTHRRQTVMFGSINNAEGILHYSNPNVNFSGQATGTATRNNAQILRGNACAVAAYRGATNNLQVNINGPIQACPFDTECFSASVSGAPGPYTYQWSWTTNGSSYTNFGTGGNACLSFFQFNAPLVVTIRLTVTGSGQTQTDYHDVFVSQNGGQITCAQKVGTSPEIPVSDLEGAENTLAVVPNPAGFKANVALYLTEASEVKIGVYSVTGQLVKAVQQGSLAKGHHKVAMDISDIPSGVYLIQVSSDKINLVKRLMIAR